MATADTSLETLLREYIQSGVYASPLLKQKLRSASVDERYYCLREVNDTDLLSKLKYAVQLRSRRYKSDKYGITAVHRAASLLDLEGLKFMLHGFTSDQIYKIMQLSNDSRLTPLLSAVTYDPRLPSPFETVAFIFADLSAEQKYELLKAQHINGDTALHRAVNSNCKGCIQLFLSSLTLGQQHHLLSIKGRDGKSVAEISPSISTNYMTMTTAKELTDTKQKMEMQKQDIAAQKQEIAGQKQEIAGQKQEISAQKQQIAAQKQEIDAQKGSITALENAMQVMTERQQAMEMMLEQLQIELSRPIVTDETGDQEIEELEDE